MTLLGDVLRDLLQSDHSYNNKDDMDRKPLESTTGDIEGGTTLPSTMQMMKEMGDTSKPGVVSTDSGQIVDYNPNPFSKLADINAERGTIRNFLGRVMGQTPERDAKGIVPDTGTGGGSDLTPPDPQMTSPTPSRKQRQPNLRQTSLDDSNQKVQPPIEPGNIDLSTRPQVHNADGSTSTVLSKSFNFGGKEVLLPTISPDGQPLSDQQSIDLYRQTGKHLGIYANPASADAYARIIHNQQQSQISNPYEQPSALDPNQIEQLRQSLLAGAGQTDPNNPNGLAGRMSGPYSKVDQQNQAEEAQSISSQFHRRNY